MPRPAYLERAAAAVVALLLIMLSGCQSPPSADMPKTVEPWRILERVGQVRAASHADALAQAVHTGDVLTGKQILSTGRGGLAIIKAGGIQLTLGEDTSVRLSKDEAHRIALDKGWLRVRAATPANRRARFITDYFHIHSSDTVLVLRAHHDGADVSVDSGRVVLATMDGQHRAALEAGAGAMVDRTTSHDLMIKRASSEQFVKLAPLSAKTTEDSAPSSTTPTSKAHQPASAQKDNTIIRPASRLLSKTERERLSLLESEVEAPITRQNSPVRRLPKVVPAVSERTPSSLSVEPLDGWPSHAPPLAPSPSIDDNGQPPSLALDTTDELDMLQLQFDLLTEGLADDL